MEHADYLMQHALQGLECHDLLASLTKGAGLAIRLLPHSSCASGLFYRFTQLCAQPCSVMAE